MYTLDYILQKYHLDPSQRSPIDIMSAGRVDLAQLFAELGFTTGTEIGVETGIYSEILCRANPKLKLYCIDPWKAYSGYREHTSQAKLEGLYQETLKRLKSYNCQIVRKFSEEAYQDIPNESLDFVYIDGNHEFLYIAQDLSFWTPKVRNGGIIAGHDFIRPAENTANLITLKMWYRRIPMLNELVPGLYYAVKPKNHPLGCGSKAKMSLSSKS